MAKCQRYLTPIFYGGVDINVPIVINSPDYIELNTRLPVRMRTCPTVINTMPMRLLLYNNDTGILEAQDWSVKFTGVISCDGVSATISMATDTPQPLGSYNCYIDAYNQTGCVLLSAEL